MAAEVVGSEWVQVVRLREWGEEVDCFSYSGAMRPMAKMVRSLLLYKRSSCSQCVEGRSAWSGWGEAPDSPARLRFLAFPGAT